MKTIGLIGGMSSQSSAEYYRLINEMTQARLGGHHNARSLMLTVDFAEIEALQHTGDWARIAALMCDAARRLEAAGADLLVLCTNTVHKVAAEIEAAVRIPFLHIADAAGDEIRAAGLRTVALLGTRFTMEEDFYRGRLERCFGIAVLTPDEADRTEIHRVIYEELCHGRVVDESRRTFQRIIAGLKDRGAEGVILGCTEIPMLISPADSPLPVFDTTAIHAQKAVDWASR